MMMVRRGVAGQGRGEIEARGRGRPWPAPARHHPYFTGPSSDGPDPRRPCPGASRESRARLGPLPANDQDGPQQARRRSPPLLWSARFSLGAAARSSSRRSSTPSRPETRHHGDEAGALACLPSSPLTRRSRTDLVVGEANCRSRC